MTEKLIAKAIEEIEQQNFAVTKQYFSIHSIPYENGKPKVARVDTDRKDDVAIVYFPVEEEDFFIAVYLKTKPQIEVQFVGSEAGNAVYLRVISDTLTLDEIKAITKLEPARGWNKGDRKPTPHGHYTFSAFFLEPDPVRADEVEDKIAKLLDLLEQDREGITKMARQAKAMIQVHWHSHNGNGMLGGLYLDKEMINRMAALELEIDFDVYTGGNPFE